jgi:HK97 gp10 family phage protein
VPYAVIVVDQDQFFVRAEERAVAGDQVLIVDAAEDVSKRIVEAARALAPKRSGKLATEGIGASLEYVSKTEVRVVAGLKREPYYGIYVHEGTGIYGDYHRPIFAHMGNVFAFRAGTREVFTRHTLGQRPQPFMREALLLVENTYIPARVQELGTELSHP